MKRVIVVDDSMEFGRMVRDTLLTSHPDLKVLVVPSAEEALLETARATIDLLVSDIRLPGISGMDLVAKIRVRHPEIRVIIVTGQPDPTRYENEAKALHVDGFFRKPMMMSDFMAVAERSLYGDEAPTKPIEKLQKFITGALLKPKTGQLVPHAVDASAQMVETTQAAMGVGTQPAGSEDEEARLSQLLTELRQRLGSLAVYLLNDVGHVMAKTGDFPDPTFEAQWVPAGLAALGALARLTRLAGSALPEAVQVVRGPALDVLMAPVGTYSLVVALRSGRSALRVALAVEEVLEAQKDLAAALQKMGLNILPISEMALAAPAGVPAVHIRQEETVEAPSEPETGLDEFAALFDGKVEAPQPIDADSFWDNLANTSPAVSNNPDGLSFDQAKQLGLAPDEPEGK